MRYLKNKTPLFHYLPTQAAFYVTMGAMAWLFATEKTSIDCHTTFIEEVDFKAPNEHTGVTAKLNAEQKLKEKESK